MIRQTRTFALAFGGALVLLATEPAQPQQTTAAGVPVPTVRPRRPSKKASFSAGWSMPDRAVRCPGPIVTLQGTGPTAEAEADASGGLDQCLDGLAGPPIRRSSPTAMAGSCSGNLRPAATGSPCGPAASRPAHTDNGGQTVRHAASRSNKTSRCWTRRSRCGATHPSPAVSSTNQAMPRSVPRVNLVRVTLASGRRRLAAGGSATTDDRGHYRFGTLLPGSYLVQVRSNVTSMPPSVIAGLSACHRGRYERHERAATRTMMMGPPTSGVRVGDHLLQYGSADRAIAAAAAADDGRLSIYPTMFYPAASSSAQAAWSRSSSGEERTGIDMQLKLVRAVDRLRVPSRGRMDRRT